jgi:hypothetical protein
MPKAASTVFGPSRKRRRLAGVIDVAGLAHHLQVGDRGAGGFEQRQRFGLGIERAEACALPACQPRGVAIRRARTPSVSRSASAR